ncbi:antibiotic biosynthesis monooxygenase family protein [Vibrio coralliilyticus]|uniref:antibiotic biosynthesis monooxygenase family protein n=1 Tax=Vibrio coralliilyticus TaxID=190893 RepID=UPI000381E56D|nr:antibiotic biosynthesis monooxygenase [Vibrio coralliilyticus]
MIAVIFEVTPKSGAAPHYFDLANQLKEALHHMEGFVSVERFQSLSRPETFLSLSFWRDEQAVEDWRTHFAHQQAQQLGQASLFADYRIRVAHVVRDYGVKDGAVTRRTQ